MAKGNIKGITVEIGGDTSPLNKALKEVNGTIKDTQSELKDVNKLLKFDTNNVTLTQQKHTLLKNEISATVEKLKSLKEVQGQVKDQYKSGEIDAGQFRAFQRELESTQSKLKELKDQKNDVSVIGSAFGSVKDKVSEVSSKLQPFETALKSVGKASASITSAGVSAVGTAVGATGKAVAAYTGTVAAAGAATVGMASDLNEVQNVVDTVFGADNSKKIDNWATAASNAYGLSETEAKKMTSTMGAMLKSQGMSADATYNMSTKLSGLAGDMASFYNLSSDDAFEKIRAGISGETEPLKELGINMSEANLNQEAMREGMTKTYNQMSQAEQTQLRYNYIMKATTDAQGDFAKTSGSFANQQRIAEEQVKSMATTMGQSFLPVFGTTLQTFTSSMPQIQSSFKALFSGDAGASAQLGSTLTNMLKGMITNLATSLPSLLSNLNILIATLLSSISAALPTLMNTLVPVIIQGFSNLVLSIIPQVPILLPQIINAGLQLLMGLLTSINQIIPPLMAALPSIITSITATLVANLPAIIQGGFQLLIGLIQGITNCIPQLIDAIVALIPVLVDSLTSPDGLTQLITAGLMLIVALAEGLPKAIPAIIKAIPQIIFAIQDALMNQDWIGIGIDILKGVAEGLIEGVKAIGDVIADCGKRVVDGFKNFFGIHSPSTMFKNLIGKNLAAGIGIGFTEEMDNVAKDMTKSVPTNFTAKVNTSGIDTAMQTANAVTMALNAQQTGNGQYTAKWVLDGRTLAQALFEPLADESARRGLGGALA